MSQTDKNLQEAFAGESQARNKYMVFAKVARKEGFHYVADILEETAINEEQHAKDQLKLLQGLGDTKTNLQAAVAGEHYETTTMYPAFAETAKKEGNQQAAAFFKQLTKIEAEHRDRFQKLLDLLKDDSLFKRKTPVTWICIKCGWTVEGSEPPEKCPACKHPRNYFKPSDF
jgi:rubrerythrin